MVKIAEGVWVTLIPVPVTIFYRLANTFAPSNRARRAYAKPQGRLAARPLLWILPFPDIQPLLVFSRDRVLGRSGPGIAYDVKEDRGGEDETVCAVEHAAVTFNHVAPVLHAAVPFDGGCDEPAEKAHDTGDACKDTGLER
jgi:hypothetical protein